MCVELIILLIFVVSDWLIMANCTSKMDCVPVRSCHKDPYLAGASLALLLAQQEIKTWLGQRYCPQHFGSDSVCENKDSYMDLNTLAAP